MDKTLKFNIQYYSLWVLGCASGFFCLFFVIGYILSTECTGGAGIIALLMISFLGWIAYKSIMAAYSKKMVFEAENAIEEIDFDINVLKQKIDSQSTLNNNDPFLKGMVKNQKIKEEISIKQNLQARLVEQTKCDTKKSYWCRKREAQALKESMDNISIWDERINLYNPIETISLEQKRDYLKLVELFDEINKCKQVSKVVNQEENKNKRSLVDTNVVTQPCVLKRDNCEDIYQEPTPPIFESNDGFLFYLYPQCVVVRENTIPFGFNIFNGGDSAFTPSSQSHGGFGGNDSFSRESNNVEIISYVNFMLQYVHVRFHTNEKTVLPSDAEIIGQTYLHTNKDGSKDNRYRESENPSFPIISIGCINMEKYKICYHFSNAEKVKQFISFYNYYISQWFTKNSKANERGGEAATPLAQPHTKVCPNDGNTERKKSQDPFNLLGSLIGLKEVKREISELVSLIKIRQVRAAQGLNNPPMSYHCVFTGNPGTGKTTVARIIAEVYKELGIIKKGHLIETDRSGLVAEYLGQTATKTNAVIDSALDGVLFIDEAYALSDERDMYGKEAINTLLKRMEDDRARLIVILAGYTNKMKMFISTNPGLESRFNRYIEFEDYSVEELISIFQKLCKENDYQIEDGATCALYQIIRNEYTGKNENFGNARFVRNLFEKTISRQAKRLSSVKNVSSQELTLIKQCDFISE